MFFLDLPPDILMNVMKFLDISDLRNVMLTCKTLHQMIIQNNTIWRFMCHRTLVLQKSSRNKLENKCSFYNLCRISKNWRQGIFFAKDIIKHNTQFMPSLTLHHSGSLLLSLGSELRCYGTDKRGYPNGRDLIWKVNVPIIKRNDVRTNDISRFITKKNTVVCGNRDGCVAVYDWSNPRLQPRLTHHIKDCHQNGLSEVTAIEAIKDCDRTCVITACSYSPQLAFWCLNDDNTSEYEKQSIIVNEAVGIKCLSLNEYINKLAFGLNGNSKPMLLDITKNKLSLNSNDTRNVHDAVRDIQWMDNNTVVYVTHSGKLQAIDIRSEKLTYDTMDPFQSALYCLKTDGHCAIMVGTRENSRCVLYDVRKINHIQLYFTQLQKSPIYSLDFDVKKLVAAADRSVAVLNFNINISSAEPKDYSHSFEYVPR